MAEKRSALVVATSVYEDARLAPLGGPGEDAEALEKVLGDAEIGGFDVQLALNVPHDELRTTLEGFFADRARDDLLLIHFSGHGLKDDDGQLYLAATDTRIDRLLSTGVDASFVNKLMTKCRSEKIALFLDCCFGGAFTTALTRRAGVDTAGVKETFNGTGRFVITASDAMQYSFEGGQRVDDGSPSPSPFTGALVEGLMSGEADRNEDGFVSINELFDYLEDRVHELSPSQTPTKSAFNQVGDWVIAQSMRAPTIRILPASVQAQLKSEDALDRFSALIDLRDLIQGSDPRVADAAMKALEKLTGDDSRRVAAAASRLFGDLPGGPRPVTDGVVIETRMSESDLPDVVKDALVKKPDAIPGEPMAAQPGSPAPPAVTPMSTTTAAARSAVAPAPSPSDTPPPSVHPAAPAPAPAPSVAAPPPAVAWTAPPAQPARPAAPSGPLWGTPSVAATTPAVVANTASPAPATVVAPARASQTVGPPWSLGRALGRAAIGAVLATLVQLVWLLAANPEILADEGKSTLAGGYFGQILVYFVLAATIFTGLIEGVIKSLRIPSGSAWRVVGHNRWIVALIVGGLMGLIVGVAAEVAVFGTDFASLEGTGLEIVLTAAVGWLIAEAIVGRRASSAKTAAA